METVLDHGVSWSQFAVLVKNRLDNRCAGKPRLRRKYRVLGIAAKLQVGRLSFGDISVGANPISDLARQLFDVFGLLYQRKRKDISLRRLVRLAL